MKDNNNNNQAPAVCGIIAIIAAALALPVRTLIYLNNIEANTGFYTTVDAKVYLFFAVIAISAVTILTLSFISRKKLAFNMSAEKRPACAAMSLACAATIGYNAYTEMMTDYSASVQFIVTSNIPKFLVYGISLMAVFSAVYFILMTVVFISGKSCGQAYKVLSLTPVLWSVFRLTIRFTRTVSYMRVSDIMLEMLMLVCFAVFFMSFAQVNSQVNGEGLEWKIVFAGSLATLFGIVVFIPRLILTLTGKSDLMYILSSADPCDIAVGLFTLSTVLTRFKTPVKDPEAKTVADQPEETENAEEVVE